VPDNLLAPALAIARTLEAEIAAALTNSGRGERLRDGMVVAIAGPPNAGKSTLLNRLARREAAIVSPYAGTTRDVIEVHLDLGGWPVTLLDTAGIRDTEDPVELEGVRRARERAADADLVLWVVDAGDSAPDSVIPGREQSERTRNDNEIENGPKSFGSASSTPPTWLIRNKIDLIKGGAQRNEPRKQRIGKSEAVANPTKSLKNMVNKESTNRNEQIITNNESEYSISAVTGIGVDKLLSQLAHQAEGCLAGSESALVTRQRHRLALEEVLAALRRAQAPDAAGREDLLAEELRIAARALGRLTGRVDVEDILDAIFREFCIGK